MPGRTNQLISIHTPVKGVTGHPVRPAAAPRHFNPHTREGCDAPPRVTPGPGKGISIHTPVKGVTAIWRHPQYSSLISIHTPVKGVTVYLDKCKMVEEYFNPHTREGCDLRRRFLRLFFQISIHTPVKGVTPGSLPDTPGTTNFNPHTREGCDCKTIRITAPPIKWRTG